MAYLFKGLLVTTITLQLLIAFTQVGWLRSTAELSAFLLVVVLSFMTIKANSKKIRRSLPKE